jgi:hypothetical protein
MKPNIVMNVNTTNDVNSQSMLRTKPARAAAGSCGRGWTGGGSTNWNSSVVVLSRTLPRDVSLSLIWKCVPALRAAPLLRIWSRSWTPPGNPTRPDILSVKFRM